MCAYAVVTQLFRQKTFLRLASVSAVANWNGRVVAALIGVHKLIAIICYIEMQHAAYSRTDGHKRIVSRISNEQGRIRL